VKRLLALSALLPALGALGINALFAGPGASPAAGSTAGSTAGPEEGAAPQEAQARQPNIILFMVDDMGWMDSEPYGSQYYRTPNMVRLAEQSMRFTHAYAEPLCSPTRASLLSGQYSARHGLMDGSGHQAPRAADFKWMPDESKAYQPLRAPFSRNCLEPEHYTLAEALRDGGYRTGHFGKWHLGVEQRHWPEAAGFDVAWHSEPSAGPPGYYFSPYGVLPPGSPATPGKRHFTGTITDGENGEYITDRLTDEALAFMESSQDKPFFLNLWHFGVHGPWGHKEEYTRAFAETEDPSGRQGNPIMASMLQSVDESLGRVMDRVDELGLADNTLFIFYSDNGGNVHSMKAGSVKAAREKQDGGRLLRDYRHWAGGLPPTSNAPLRGGKGTIYEGGVRVPLMVRWPSKIKKAAVSETRVAAIDFYPTLLEVAGLERPAQQVLDGLSILPVLTQEDSLHRDVYFTWQPRANLAISVHSGPWKLIRRLRLASTYPGHRELYHLGNDIGEANNLAAVELEKTRELDLLIDGFVRDMGALYPQPNPSHLYPGAPPAARGIAADECRLDDADGALRVTTEAGMPTLRVDSTTLHGPVECRLELRSLVQGTGTIRWTTDEQWYFPEEGQAATFGFEGSPDWQAISVALPIEGASRMIEWKWPESARSFDIKSIRFVSSATGDELSSWEFQ
jgi:arylsulfatase A-like enzyme